MLRRIAGTNKLLILIPVAVALCACNDESGGYPQAIPVESIRRPVMIIAHRGGMAYAPENTVIAMQNGEQLLSDMLELDVHVREDEIVVLHDLTLGRTTNCDMEIEHATATAREECDAGYWWRPGASKSVKGGGPTSFRGTGVKVPLLADVVNAVSSNVLLLIELKHVRRSLQDLPIEEAVDALVTFIVQNQLEARAWITSSNARALARVEAAAPSIPTVLTWGTDASITCERTVSTSISLGFDAVLLQSREPAQPGFASCVQDAQDAGLKVMFWIANRPADVERLLPLGPDGLVTDYPACLAALLRDVRVENPYPEIVHEGRSLRKCG